MKQLLGMLVGAPAGFILAAAYGTTTLRQAATFVVVFYLGAALGFLCAAFFAAAGDKYTNEL